MPTGARFLSFYRKAVTPYQLHSPLAAEIVAAVLADDRWFYAFRDVEIVRERMLQSTAVLQMTDYGSGQPVQKMRPLRELVRTAASSPEQGRRLFRLALWRQPATMLELGTSTGIGTLYAAAAARRARFLSLEGCPAVAGVARTNLEILGFKNTEVRTGPFSRTLDPALRDLSVLDFVYLDGHHNGQATIAYFEKCLQHSNEKTVFVLDDVYWSEDMQMAWQFIKDHPRVTMTLDFFDLAVVILRREVREKQHLRVVPYIWKPWKVL